MFSANVMSFMRKMALPDTGTTESVTPEEGGTTFSKLKQFGSGLIMATGNVTKLGPGKSAAEDTQPKEDPILGIIKPKSETGGKVSTGEECRVCRKSFGPDEVSKTCCECQQKVCEDCASYSTTTNSDDPSSWRCSVCRRKIASRDQPIVAQESTDSMLEVPMLEALQRRHSEARLGCQSGTHIGTLGTGLAPPRSTDIRRHSDVSPASLKELEKYRKVTGEQREELRWERELERKSKSRATSPDRHPEERGRSGSISQKVGVEASPMPDRKGSVRHKSRMTRQRSYDDEMKTVGVMPSGGGQHAHADPGLGLPVQLPRRASAYDVYAAPGSGGLNAMVIAAAQQRASISGQGDRKPLEERSTGRRASFRAVNPPMPYDVAPVPVVPVEPVVILPPAVVSPAVMAPGEERRNRRRGSQLPDISAIRALSSQAQAAGKVVPPPVVNRVAAEDRELPRQGSLVDGESIKIVIHHADNDTVPPPAFPAPRENAWRVKLWLDPNLDKGHRSDGYGLRVVGGKIGADGRTFAYIVWVDPDGPAAKAGLQCGDKVLKWAGVSLVDRTFEEVAQIIERPDKRPIIELIVEHATDAVGDLQDDMGSVQQPGKVPSNLGLLMETETDKAPSSPTRRKLPKTPV